MFMILSVTISWDFIKMFLNFVLNYAELLHTSNTDMQLISQ